MDACRGERTGETSTLSRRDNVFTSMNIQGTGANFANASVSISCHARLCVRGLSSIVCRAI